MKSNLFKVAALASLSVVAGCTSLPSDFVWGDDSSVYANDGDCDDPRFGGPGAYSVNLAEDAMRDATDCRALYEADRVQLNTNYRPGVNYENPDYVRQAL